MVSNPNKLTFVFTGRIDRAKGVQELAEASRILGKKRDDFEVLIVGDGPELGSLISRYGALEHIKFLGYRIDVNDILTESDIFVLPSYREGMSISLMEALSCGVPFLTTDVGGVADVLRNGAKGFVIDKPSVKQLVKSMEQVMNTSKLILSEMGLTNFEVVQNRYSWDCIADQYIALYDSLI
jgi:glycosyltransferase involved in cell wall biosynthesis